MQGRATMLIGELAKRSGLSKDGLRHYEALGLIHSKPVRAGSRIYRDYDDSTLERLALIALGKRLQFRLSEMPETLDRILSDQISREDRAAALRVKLAEVDARIADLTDARNLLAEIAGNPDKPFVDTRLKELGLWLED